MAGNMRRNIEVANGQVDHVSEAIQVAISRGAVLNDFDNPVKALTDGIGQAPVGEGDDVIEIRRDAGVRQYGQWCLSAAPRTVHAMGDPGTRRY